MRPILGILTYCSSIIWNFTSESAIFLEKLMTKWSNDKPAAAAAAMLAALHRRSFADVASDPSFCLTSTHSRTWFYRGSFWEGLELNQDTACATHCQWPLLFILRSRHLMSCRSRGKSLNRWKGTNGARIWYYRQRWRCSIIRYGTDIWSANIIGEWMERDTVAGWWCIGGLGWRPLNWKWSIFLESELVIGCIWPEMGFMQWYSRLFCCSLSWLSYTNSIDSALTMSVVFDLLFFRGNYMDNERSVYWCSRLCCCPLCWQWA